MTSSAPHGMLWGSWADEALPVCLPLSRVMVVSERVTETLLRQDTPSSPRSSFFTVTLKNGSRPGNQGVRENVRRHDLKYF